MSHYNNRPPQTPDVHFSPDSDNVEQILDRQSDVWGSASHPHSFDLKVYHLTMSLKSPGLSDPIVSALSRKEALQIPNHRYAFMPSFTDPLAAQEFVHMSIESTSNETAPNLQHSRLKPSHRLEMCYSSERRPRRLVDVILKDPVEVVWDYHIKDHNPMLDFACRKIKEAESPNISVIGFDGMKMSGQPLVKDRFDNIWIEDRCDFAVMAMSSYGLTVPTQDAPRQFHIALWIIRANAVIRFWKDFAWEEPRDMFFARTAYQIVLAGLQARKLGLLEPIENELPGILNHEMEPETLSLLSLCRPVKESSPVTASIIEAVADMTACFGIEAFNFISNTCANVDLEGKELLLRVAQIMLHVRREERKDIVSFMECNQWLFDILDYWQVDDVRSENVRHMAAKILMDILSRQEEYEDLDVEPLREEDLQGTIPLNHHSVQLADYAAFPSAVRTRHGITAREWVHGRYRIPLDVENSHSLRRESDGAKFKALVTSTGSLIITKNNLFAKMQKALSRIRAVAIEPVTIEVDYNCAQDVSHDTGGSAVSSLLGGAYGDDGVRWMLGCLHRGKLQISSQCAANVPFVPNATFTDSSPHMVTSMLPKRVMSKMAFLTNKKEVYWAPGDGLNVFRLSRRKYFYDLEEMTARLSPSNFFKCTVNIHADVGAT